jgi:hypothetical protein
MESRKGKEYNKIGHQELLRVWEKMKGKFAKGKIIVEELKINEKREFTICDCILWDKT